MESEDSMPFYHYFILPKKSVLESRLSCCKSCYRHAEGRAGYIVKTDLVAELNGGRIAAVLTAYTAGEVGTNTASEFNSHLLDLT